MRFPSRKTCVRSSNRILIGFSPGIPNVNRSRTGSTSRIAPPRIVLVPPGNAGKAVDSFDLAVAVRSESAATGNWAAVDVHEDAHENAAIAPINANRETRFISGTPYLG